MQCIGDLLPDTFRFKALAFKLKMPDSQNIFSARLSQSLKAKGWSVSKLSRKTGIANSSFSRWKTGVQPDLASVQKVAEALEESVSFFLSSSSSDVKEDLPTLSDAASTDNQDGLSNGSMVTLQSPQEKRRQRLEMTLKEISPRLLSLPDASPKKRQALLSQIDARIKEFVEYEELDAIEKPHN